MKRASKSLKVRVQIYNNFMSTQVFLMSDQIRMWSDICQNTTKSKVIIVTAVVPNDT